VEVWGFFPEPDFLLSLQARYGGFQVSRKNRLQIFSAVAVVVFALRADLHNLADRMVVLGR
jgi:hypothetical protein